MSPEAITCVRSADVDVEGEAELVLAPGTDAPLVRPAGTVPAGRPAPVGVGPPLPVAIEVPLLAVFGEVAPGLVAPEVLAPGAERLMPFASRGVPTAAPVVFDAAPGIVALPPAVLPVVEVPVEVPVAMPLKLLVPPVPFVATVPSPLPVPAGAAAPGTNAGCERPALLTPFVVPFASAPVGVGVVFGEVAVPVAPFARPPAVLPLFGDTPGVSVSVGGVLPTDVPEFVELEPLSFAALDFELLEDGEEATK